MSASATAYLDQVLSEELQLTRRPSLANEAADKLRDMILLEKLPPGAILPEQKLSAALKISRTPLREAIRLLSNEGLVDYQGRSARVANPSIDDIEQYMNVLGALEGLAGSKAAVNASDSELTNIKLLCEFMLQKRGQMQPLLAFNKDMEFHLSIVQAARNAPLIETHRQYNSRLWRARYISSQRQTGYQVTEQEHVAIVEALMRRDATATATAMVKHLQTGVQNIRQIMQEQNSSATP